MSKYIIRTHNDFTYRHGHEQYECDYCDKDLPKTACYFSNEDCPTLIYCFCNESCMNVYLLERITNG